MGPPVTPVSALQASHSASQNEIPTLRAYVGTEAIAAIPPAAPGGAAMARTAEFDGELLIACSEVAMAAMPELEAEFEARTDGLDLRLQVTSDRSAVKRVLAQSVPAALIATELTPGERDQGMVSFPVNDLVLTVVAHPTLEFSSLEQTYLRQILTGTINHWSWIGSDAGHLALVLPRPGTMAGLIADEFAPGNALTERSIRYSTAREGLDILRTTPGSVGIMRLAEARKVDGVKILQIDARAPGKRYVRGGYYPFGRTIYLACRLGTKGDVDLFHKTLLKIEADHSGR